MYQVCESPNLQKLTGSVVDQAAGLDAFSDSVSESTVGKLVARPSLGGPDAGYVGAVLPSALP